MLRIFAVRLVGVIMKCELIKNVVSGHGHKVSNSNVKTKRMFGLNVHNGRFFSYSLGLYINVKIPNRTRRTIDKFGDLDSFLLGIAKRKLTDYALRLRRRVEKRKAAIAAVAAA